MKRVLIATDGSAAANEAVEIGVELARDEGAEAIFVHVVTTADMVAMNGFGLMGYVPNEPTDWDEHILDDALAVADSEGVPAGTASCEAIPLSRLSAMRTPSTQTSSSVGLERSQRTCIGAARQRVTGAFTRSKRPGPVVRAAAVPEPSVV